MMQVIHYRRKCIGCGCCAEQVPDLFAMNRTDGKATLLQALESAPHTFIRRVPSDFGVDLERASSGCPVHIIQTQVLRRK
jgi:ferredoxin